MTTRFFAGIAGSNARFQVSTTARLTTVYAQNAAARSYMDGMRCITAVLPTATTAHHQRRHISSAPPPPPGANPYLYPPPPGYAQQPPYYYQAPTYPPPPGSYYPPPPQGNPYEGAYSAGPSLRRPAPQGGDTEGDAKATSAALGSKERPMVVVGAQQPRSWGSRLWILLFVMIGISATLHIIEEIEARSGGDAGGGGLPGGPSGKMAKSLGLGNSQEVKPVDLDAQQITFSDVQGVDEAKEELQEIVQFLKNPDKFTALGGRLPKGALLVGPPGCGKTMLAKAIAKEADVKFFYAAGSEFDEMFVGLGAKRVRELFAAAKQNAPALIFIDEIDALGGKRTSKDHSYSRMTLNQLLAEMDGFQSSEAVIVIAATNTPDTLDAALVRPGRFDTQISVDPPDLRGRAKILDGYLKKIKRNSSFTSMDIARSTSGFTGADLSHLVNVAAIRAAILDKKEVTSDEIEYAKDRVMMGAENKSKVVPESEKRITAYHEGGHALVALLLEKEGTDPVHKATIVPRGSGIMGLVQQQPTDDRYSQTKKQMLNRLKVCLAGRVAEELLLGDEDVTTGASSDFQQATRMARGMVRRFGFSDTMSVVDYESAETNEGAFMSDATKAKLEEEVKHLVVTAHNDTRVMLKENYSTLDTIAKELLIYETLTGDELKAIVRGEKLTKSIPVKVVAPVFEESGKNGGGGVTVTAPVPVSSIGGSKKQEVDVSPSK